MRTFFQFDCRFENNITNNIIQFEAKMNKNTFEFVIKNI